MMVAAAKYRMSFGVGGLMLNESIVIAQAYQPGENWASARERLLAQGASSLPKLASQIRDLRPAVLRSIATIRPAPGQTQ